MTAGLLRTIRDQIEGIWTPAWAVNNAAVPVYWRENDTEVLPDPGVTPYFLRNEISFGRERVRAFGGGLAANERVKFGSVLVRVFAARALQNDDTALDLLSAAEGIFRSVRQGNLSFIGDSSGFDDDGTITPEWEAGNWYMRGSLIVFQYRFVG